MSKTIKVSKCIFKFINFQINIYILEIQLLYLKSEQKRSFIAVIIVFGHQLLIDIHTTSLLSLQIYFYTLYIF